MEDVEEILEEFLAESAENLDQLDRDLVALEAAPGSRELLSSIFRTLHTLKGTAGFLAFSNLEKLAHAGENLLVELRDGKRTMDQATTDVLLGVVDQVRLVLADVAATRSDAGTNVDAQVHAVRDLMARAAQPTGTTTPEPTDQGPAPAAPPASQTPVTASPTAAHRAARIVEHTPVVAGPTAAAPGTAAPPTATDAAGARAGDGGPIRVDVRVLDDLMRNVGELVLARNQITRFVAGEGDIDLTGAAGRLNLIAAQLQDGVMKTRMQPLEHLWSKMPRVVRDLASSLGRQVNLQTDGGDTEVDRGLLEAVKDPLTHLVRNAIDHGIEPPDERAAAGKPATGTVTLRGYHAGGLVVIEVSDDGRGIDPAKVADAAVAKGLRTRDQVDAATDAELLNLLFTPGFSTAATVTNVSGRGVGMDVVRTKVEAVSGTVDVQSTPGGGTTWRMRIPLTLAIMPALLVQAGGQLYAIPQVNLVELVAIDDRPPAHGVEHVHTMPVYRLRGKLLPLLDLGAALGRPAAGATGVIAVVQLDTTRVGLVVDRVRNTEEIVVKALPPVLKGLGAYTGATILSDGQVALILDVAGLARRCVHAETGTEARPHDEVGATSTPVVKMLVVDTGGGHRVAMPLGDVARLETVEAASIEHVANRPVVQYRGAILPLVDLGSALSCGASSYAVVVLDNGTQRVGLLAAGIVDIIDDDQSTRTAVDSPGLIGQVVLAGKVTGLLDVPAAVRRADPAFHVQLAGAR